MKRATIGPCGGISGRQCTGIYERLSLKYRMNPVARDRPDSRLWENPAPLIFLPALKDFTCMIEKLMESGEKYLVTSTIILFFLKDKNQK